MAPNGTFTAVFLVVCTFGLTAAHLDLYMNETETRRLLGIPGELYYVREGIINSYALSFNLPIKTEVRDIYFTWRNLRKSPPAPAMYYNMGVTVSNPRAMGQPVASINKEGIVPTKLTAFKMSLPCTGLMSVEVDIVIQLNISIFSASNLTMLNIKRRKTCLKDDFRDVNEKHVLFPDETANASYSFPMDASHVENIETTPTHVFYIAVSVACAVILLIAFIVAVYYIKGQKTSHNERMRPQISYGQGPYGPYLPYLHKSETSSSAALSHQGHTFLRADTPNNSVQGLPNMRRAFTPIMHEMKPVEVHSILREIQVERNRITLSEVLLEGTFGKIYHGTLIGEDENRLSAEQDVYVKTVNDQARPDQVDNMLREACIMKGMVFPNCNPLIAACMDDAAAPMLVFPHLKEGNFKKFLQRCKMSEMSSHYCLSTQQLVYMAIQLIRGIQFLHRKRIVHRDVATRNCIVDSNLIVKITDTALSRDLFPNDYHCLGDNENRPIKWLALEALIDRKFSSASDVWAFGVTLWELMTLAQQPYADVDPFEMATYLKEGYRISQPINCPDELFAVMACCWALNPDERPKFSQLLICLQDFYTALGRFI